MRNVLYPAFGPIDTGRHIGPVIWSDEDLQTLRKAIVKFPPGTAARWTKMCGFIAKEGAMEKDIVSPPRWSG